jgi:hypothetical protein
MLEFSEEPAIRNGEDRLRDDAIRKHRRAMRASSDTPSSPFVPPSPPAPANSPETEQWEAYITVLVADADQQADFLTSTWPEIAFPRYAVQALIPQLDAIGAQGWEPVSIQPVLLGENGDVLVAGRYQAFARQYLCLFKRRRA